MSKSAEKYSLKFERTLEDNDYGLIISQTGSLKGIWVPDHLWDEPFPMSIVKICIENYGINPNDADEELVTSRKLH